MDLHISAQENAKEERGMKAYATAVSIPRGSASGMNAGKDARTSTRGQRKKTSNARMHASLCTDTAIEDGTATA